MTGLMNTDGMDYEQVVKVAREALVERKLTDLVVASTRGVTGLAVAKALEGLSVNLVVVGHSVGFREPNLRAFNPTARAQIEALGSKVLLGTMPFHTINDAVRAKTGGSVTTLIADALRIMGQGTKVCLEVVAMACDAGLIESGEKVLAVAGTGKGADTVLVVRSANSRRFFDLKVVEVVAKPHTF